MDVHRLRVLRAVVATGSVHGAASSLGYTPSAVSQHLTALHRETGLTLVRRSGRGIEPTSAGRAVAAEAGRVFERLADLETLIGDLAAGRVGELSVSYFASAGTAWLPPVVADLTREFPGLRLDLRLFELLGADSPPADIEIAVDGSAPCPTSHRERSLLIEPYLAVVPHTSALVGRPYVQLAELREQSWVDNDIARGHCRRVVHDACAAVGFSPPYRVEAQDYPTAIRFVAEGMGITVVPRLGLGGLPATVRTVPIVDPTPRRGISVRIRETVIEHPAAVRFVELLEDRIARDTGAETG